MFDRRKREKWIQAWGYVRDGRVANLVPVDYRRKSALMLSLFMAAESIALRLGTNPGAGGNKEKLNNRGLTPMGSTPMGSRTSCAN